MPSPDDSLYIYMAFISRNQEIVWEPNRSSYGPETWIQVTPNTMFQYENSFMRFYRNRTKPIIKAFILDILMRASYGQVMSK